MVFAHHHFRAERHRRNIIIEFNCIFFQGEDSVEYFLGLTPSGIVVLRNKTTVAYYYWPRIAKVYFKGRYFMLRVCDKNVSILVVRFVCHPFSCSFTVSQTVIVIMNL